MSNIIIEETMPIENANENSFLKSVSARKKKNHKSDKINKREPQNKATF